ncbi:hypothetical protein EMIHUDRAFT_254653 [Emiliania huxleyi CCMP1516]|uniref:Transmembrane protein n=2 Tax=Emiliania huxleyi TaxID=2903 RepID=A0A0D3JP26_EMIH1|nr:hypothetical protein EMIHUDRAFT_254653 [Emiliania huxleyi CCMP1516]EOD25261.1 hypothetical protein EMIHUDRAFT_254653 [Emiliania huxleyi CCMP1516]|eukprot:XP_005777690.1 hypothetical protein EMIHUDRAFT_254653 [Emiliania huxleyi CCMP1516]
MLLALAAAALASASAETEGHVCIKSATNLAEHVDSWPKKPAPEAWVKVELGGRVLCKTDEGSVSAFAPLVVAVIAEEVFGVSDLEVDVSCLTDDQQANNVKGLGDAIFSVCCVGWGLCCIVVFGFYYFYPRESRALNPHLVAPTRKVSSDVDGELSTDAVAPAETAKPQAAGSGAGAEEAI